MTDVPHTIKAINFVGGEVSTDGEIGWLDIETKDGKIRLEMPHAPLMRLPYVLMPLVQQAIDNAVGPGGVNAFQVDRLDIIHDDTLPGTLILRFGLGKGANLALELSPDLAAALRKEIASLESAELPASKDA